MSDRDALIEVFLQEAGWESALRSPIEGDASTRSYMRLSQEGQLAVLMNAPRGDEAPGEPEGATIEARRAIGYNALARLAGPNMEAFVALAGELRRRGFSAPEIYAVDLHNGFALLEDFGADQVYARLIGDDLDIERPLYEAAVDTLAAIYRSTFPCQMEGYGAHWSVRDYDEAALLAETDLFLDYYAPDVGRPVSEAARAEFYDLWRRAFRMFDKHAPGLCLRDYHAENLFWLEGHEAESRVGLIDFQDALYVHPAYDLASFLEDARRDVNPDLFEPLKQRFCDKSGLSYDSDFQAAYAVMAAQRNTKVIGFPVRAEVQFGKPQYRALIPRVQAHLKRDLSHEALAPLRRWFETHVPEVLQ